MGAASPRDSPVVLPDLADRRALVTGASGGIGVEIARALSAAGAHVIMPVRSRQKGGRAAETIRETVPHAQLELRELDLASMASVEAFALRLQTEGAPIHLYVVNAAISALGDPTRRLSEDGLEVHFQTNFLAHAVLTIALLPLLRDGAARVAVQTSRVAALRGIPWRDLESAHRYGPLRAYAVSKVLLGVFGFELARRSLSDGSGIIANVCHPGIVPDTGMSPILRARHAGMPAHRISARLGGTPVEGAQPALLALTAAGTGGFFGPGGVLQLSGPAVAQRPYRSLRDAAAGARAWELAEQMRPRHRA